MNYRINIITLDKNSSSAVKLLESIRKKNMEANFYSAVDGRKTPPDLLRGESVDQNKSEEYRLSTLNNAEIGAYLSHYRCIKSAYEEGIENLCILEDDINIEKDFSSILKKLIDLPKEYEFIRLMELKRCKRKIINKISGKYLLTRPEKGTLGAQGYLINREGMKKVMAHAMPIWKPIDKYYDHFWEINLQSFSIEPHIIWETLSETSIKKPNFKPKVSFKKLTYWKIQKIKRSLKRKIYIIKRRKEFYPKSKSDMKMGKTQRKG